MGRSADNEVMVLRFAKLGVRVARMRYGLVVTHLQTLKMSANEGASKTKHKTFASGSE